MRKIDFAKRNGLVFRQISLEQTFFSNPVIIEQTYAQRKTITSAHKDGAIFITTDTTVCKDLYPLNSFLFFYLSC